MKTLSRVWRLRLTGKKLTGRDSMKLLFDQKLSPRPVNLLVDLFPNSNHVFPLGMGETTDTKVWDYARANDFTLVTKDADFGDLSVFADFLRKSFGLNVEIAKPRT